MISFRYFFHPGILSSRGFFQLSLYLGKFKVCKSLATLRDDYARSAPIPTPWPWSSGMIRSKQPPAPCYRLLVQTPTAPSLPHQPECTCPTQCMWKLGPHLYCGLKPTAIMHALATVPLAHRQGDKLQIAGNRDDAHKILKQKYFVYSIITRNSHAASLSSYGIHITGLMLFHPSLHAYNMKCSFLPEPRLLVLSRQQKQDSKWLRDA